MPQCEACIREQEKLNIDAGMLLCDVCFERNQFYAKAGIPGPGMTHVSIKYHGDFFNNEMQSLIEVKKEISAIPELSEEEKRIKYQQTVMERLLHLRTVLIEQRKELQENENREHAVVLELRNFGNELREDFRKKLRESDLAYQPVVVTKKSVKPVVKKATSPFDKIAQVLAMTKGISVEDAKKEMMSNPDIMRNLNK